MDLNLSGMRAFRVSDVVSIYENILKNISLKKEGNC